MFTVSFLIRLTVCIMTIAVIVRFPDYIEGYENRFCHFVQKLYNDKIE
jgi:hypothetical protein